VSPGEPGVFALAAALEIRREIARAGWTEDDLGPALRDRLRGDGVLTLDDLAAVAVALDQDPTVFVPRVLSAAQNFVNDLT